MTTSVRTALGLSPILFALALGAYAQEPAADPHAGHGTEPPAAEGQGTAATAAEAQEAAMHKMHEEMAITPSGDPDVDFVRGMIPHHQGAIDMARIVLEHGDDPEIRALAEEVIAAQEGEIQMMRDWLKANGHAE